MMEEIYTIKQVAEKIQLQEKTVREWLRTGKMKGVKLGRIWRIREQDLIQFLEDRSNKKNLD